MDLDQVFRKCLAAEQMDEEDVIALFNPPPGFGSCLESSNQILLGPKGSGKSIALKWLAFLPDRPMHNKPDYYGLWIPIGRFQFDYVRQLFDPTGNSKPFLGYMNFYLLDRILLDLQREHWKGKFDLHLPTSYRAAISGFSGVSVDENVQSSKNIITIRGIINDIQESFRGNIRVGELESEVFKPICGIESTISLLREFAELVNRDHNHRKVAILLDGFDNLRDLGRSLVSLLSKDEPHSERIITKAACRILPKFLHAGSSVSLEEGRDYFIFPCGVDDKLEEFQIHARRVIENRLSIFSKPTSSKNVDLDSILPEKIDHPHTGLRSLALLSGGNILTFLECCAFALDIEKERQKREDIYVISPESQNKAVKLQSENYLFRDLNDQAGGFATTIRKYLGAFAACLKEQQGDKGISLILDINSFSEDDISLKEAKEAVTTACELRYIVIPNSQFVKTVRRQEPFGVEELRLSYSQAPYFDLPLKRGSPISIGRPEIARSPWIGRKPSQRQIELLTQSPSIFVSIAGDDWGENVSTRINWALRDIGKRQGNVQVEKPFYAVTFRDVSAKKEGKYLDNLVDAIKESAYVVYDVTAGITKGVAVEKGIACGMRKPHALIWLGDKPMTPEGSIISFTENLLPSEIKPTDIKIRSFPPKGKIEPFSKWYQRLVHEQNINLNEMCGFQGSGRPCVCKQFARDFHKVYLRIQPRNPLLKDTIVKELQLRNIEPIIAEEYGAPTSSETCKRLREAGAALFDVSSVKKKDTEVKVEGNEEDKKKKVKHLAERYEGSNEEVLSLLEIGYALGSSMNYHCIFMSDQGCIKTQMIGEDVISIKPVDLERSVKQFVDYFVRKILSS